MAAAHRRETGTDDASGVIDLCSNSSSSNASGGVGDGDWGDGGTRDCGCRFYAKFIYPTLLGALQQRLGVQAATEEPEGVLKADICNQDECWVTLSQLKLGLREPRFLVDLKELKEVKRRVGDFSIILHGSSVIP